MLTRRTFKKSHLDTTELLCIEHKIRPCFVALERLSIPNAYLHSNSGRASVSTLDKKVVLPQKRKASKSPSPKKRPRCKKRFKRPSCRKDNLFSDDLPSCNDEIELGSVDESLGCNNQEDLKIPVKLITADILSSKKQTDALPPVDVSPQSSNHCEIIPEQSFDNLQDSPPKCTEGQLTCDKDTGNGAEGSFDQSFLGEVIDVELGMIEEEVVTETINESSSDSSSVNPERKKESVTQTGKPLKNCNEITDSIKNVRNETNIGTATTVGFSRSNAAVLTINHQKSGPVSKTAEIFIDHLPEESDYSTSPSIDDDMEDSLETESVIPFKNVCLDQKDNFKEIQPNAIECSASNYTDSSESNDHLESNLTSDDGVSDESSDDVQHEARNSSFRVITNDNCLNVPLTDDDMEVSLKNGESAIRLKNVCIHQKDNIDEIQSDMECTDSSESSDLLESSSSSYDSLDQKENIDEMQTDMESTDSSESSDLLESSSSSYDCLDQKDNIDEMQPEMESSDCSQSSDLESNSNSYDSLDQKDNIDEIQTDMKFSDSSDSSDSDDCSDNVGQQRKVRNSPPSQVITNNNYLNNEDFKLHFGEHYLYQLAIDAFLKQLEKGSKNVNFRKLYNKYIRSPCTVLTFKKFEAIITNYIKHVAKEIGIEYPETKSYSKRKGERTVTSPKNNCEFIKACVNTKRECERTVTLPTNNHTSVLKRVDPKPAMQQNICVTQRQNLFARFISRYMYFFKWCIDTGKNQSGVKRFIIKKIDELIQPQKISNYLANLVENSNGDQFSNGIINVQQELNYWLRSFIVKYMNDQSAIIQHQKYFNNLSNLNNSLENPNVANAGHNSNEIVNAHQELNSIRMNRFFVKNMNNLIQPQKDFNNLADLDNAVEKSNIVSPERCLNGIHARQDSSDFPHVLNNSLIESSKLDVKRPLEINDKRLTSKNTDKMIKSKHLLMDSKMAINYPSKSGRIYVPIQSLKSSTGVSKMVTGNQLLKASGTPTITSGTRPSDNLLANSPKHKSFSAQSPNNLNYKVKAIRPLNNCDHFSAIHRIPDSTDMDAFKCPFKINDEGLTSKDNDKMQLLKDSKDLAAKHPSKLVKLNFQLQSLKKSSSNVYEMNGRNQPLKVSSLTAEGTPPLRAQPLNNVLSSDETHFYNTDDLMEIRRRNAMNSLQAILHKDENLYHSRTTECEQTQGTSENKKQFMNKIYDDSEKPTPSEEIFCVNDLLIKYKDMY